MNNHTTNTQLCVVLNIYEGEWIVSEKPRNSFIPKRYFDYNTKMGHF